MSLGGRPCALGKKREIVPAIPMSRATRRGNYERQNYGFPLTPRQVRRLKQKRWPVTRRAAAKLAAAGGQT